MIFLPEKEKISAIALTVLLIIYLLMAELGSEKLKKALLPFIITMLAVFILIAGASIISTYMGIK
jgi:uncharacterized protein YacL